MRKLITILLTVSMIMTVFAFEPMIAQAESSLLVQPRP